MTVPDTEQTTPATLLGAVNMLLTAIGKTHVASLLAVDSDERSRDAERLIIETNREVQQTGWNFNTNENYALEPDALTGEIALPLNTVRFKTAGRSHYRKITLRSGKLYDKEANTSVFTGTVWCDLTLLFPFEEVPPVIRSYVYAKAGQKFIGDRQPDSRTSRFTDAAVSEALSYALQYDQEERDASMVEASPHFARARRL